MLKLKPLRQTHGLCGVACLKTVLAYFGIEKSEAELAKLTNASRSRGTSLAGILKTARGLGLKASHKDNCSFSDIKKYVVVKKIPVIVDWFSENDGHYSIAVKINRKNIYLLDPEIAGIRTLTLHFFKRVWFDFPGQFMKKRNDLILRRIIIIRP